MSLFKNTGSVPTNNVTVPVATPLEAGVAALVVAIGNAAVALAVIGVSAATKLETAAVGLIAAVFLVANALHHKANAGG